MNITRLKRITFIMAAITGIFSIPIFIYGITISSALLITLAIVSFALSALNICVVYFMRE